MKKQITKERLEKEFTITGRALKAVEVTKKDPAGAKKLLDFAQRYYTDAKYFQEKSDWASAFGALNYAHAWLDARAVLGIFKINEKDKDIFVVD